MAVPFDHIATSYDSIFTRSMIGQLQRKRVWRYIEEIIPNLEGFEMLELNCGTGEDALMFSERGFNILATDISIEMLKVTSEKAERYSMQHRISSHYLDLESFDETLFDKKFDLIFSNFGGLNCINPDSLRSLLQKLPKILNPGGRFVAVVMPRFCIWESFYFLSKFDMTNALRRRNRNGIQTNLHGTMLNTWYYSPSQVTRWTNAAFTKMNSQPIGIALPPSYLEPFFKTRKRWLLKLNALEKKWKMSFLSGCADHYLIDLRLR
ncbi:MAG TPA: methyltransferase domain-containing protein [Chryseosolibacter sp.]|nr:methyltransferase domain-containing protein [Chryseosolibacter sp.]